MVTRVSLAFLQLLVNLFVPYQATEKLTPLCLSIPLVGSLLPVAIHSLVCVSFFFTSPTWLTVNQSTSSSLNSVSSSFSSTSKLSSSRLSKSKVGSSSS